MIGVRRVLRRGSLLGVTLALGACLTAEGGTGIPEPGSWTVRLTITNPGSGSGVLRTDFGDADVENACPAVLAPGEDCLLVAEATVPIVGFDLDVDPATGSDFVEYGGACQGPDPECHVVVDGESTVQLSVSVRFDVVPLSETSRAVR